MSKPEFTRAICATIPASSWSLLYFGVLGNCDAGLQLSPVLELAAFHSGKKYVNMERRLNREFMET
jgi:hypothetical protein